MRSILEQIRTKGREDLVRAEGLVRGRKGRVHEVEYPIANLAGTEATVDLERFS